MNQEIDAPPVWHAWTQERVRAGKRATDEPQDDPHSNVDLALPGNPDIRWIMPLMFDPEEAKPSKFDPGTGNIDELTDVDWPEPVLVRLHWRLLEDVANLVDPKITLLDKLDILNWIFTEPDKDGVPFSFASCLKVIGCSPLTNIEGWGKQNGLAYVGDVDTETVRDILRGRLRLLLPAMYSVYPLWVLEAIEENTAYVIRQLERDPQWINRQIATRSAQSDLFK